MARELLTDKRVRGMRAPESGRKEVFDTVRTGLCFRVTANGVKSWSLLYRFNGQQRRETLGSFPKISLARARQLAGDSLEAAGRGDDPRLLKAAQRAAEADRAADTVEVIGEQFIAKFAIQRRWREIEGIMRRDVMTAWKGRPVSDISRRDVVELVDSIADRGAPVQANRAMTVLKMFFKWCIKRGIVPADPAAGAEKPTKERARERTLTDPEIAAFWRSCESIGEPFGPLFKMLIFTGQRLGEIANLEWPEFNEVERRIEISGAKYKTGRQHTLPLPAPALEILAKRARIENCPYVFSTNGRTPLSGFSKAKRELDAAMLADLRKDAAEVALPGWRLHDLRRTCRSGLSRIGIRPDIAEKVLGHAAGGMTATYDRHTYLPELRHALDAWAAHLQDIITPSKRGKVVRLRKPK